MDVCNQWYIVALRARRDGRYAYEPTCKRNHRAYPANWTSHVKGFHGLEHDFRNPQDTSLSSEGIDRGPTPADTMHWSKSLPALSKLYTWATHTASGLALLTPPGSRGNDRREPGRNAILRRHRESYGQMWRDYAERSRQCDPAPRLSRTGLSTFNRHGHRAPRRHLLISNACRHFSTTVNFDPRAWANRDQDAG